MNQVQFFNQPELQYFQFNDTYGVNLMQKERGRFALDAELITVPNSGVPIQALSYINPEIIPVIIAPKNSTEIFSRRQTGSWVDQTAIFTVVEHAGSAEPYGDFNNAGTSTINPNFPAKSQIVIQTHIRVGVRETDTLGRVNLDLIAHSQTAAANVLADANNKINLLGLDGTNIYGLLNDPSIPGPIAATTPFANATYLEIYNNIVKVLFADLVNKTQGTIDENSEIILVMSPATRVQLGTISEYGKSVLEALQGYFTNLRIVSIPELSVDTGTTDLYLIASNIQGVETGIYGFSIDLRTFDIIQEGSGFKQKWATSNFGAIIYRPFAVAHMTGV